MTIKRRIRKLLSVFFAGKKRKSLLDLRGKIEVASNYDHKPLRSREPKP